MIDKHVILQVFNFDPYTQIVRKMQREKMYTTNLGSLCFSGMDLRSRSTRHCSPPASSMSWKSAVAVRTISVQGSWDKCRQLLKEKLGVEQTSGHIDWNYAGHIIYRVSVRFEGNPKNQNNFLITTGFAPWFSRGTPRLYCHAKRLAFRDGPAWGRDPLLKIRWAYII
jgi:hypothetical protein